MRAALLLCAAPALAESAQFFLQPAQLPAGYAPAAASVVAAPTAVEYELVRQQPEDVSTGAAPFAFPFAVCALAVAGAALRKPVARQRSSFPTMVVPARRLAASSVSRRARDPRMMPKFLKDLFPNLEKPDDPLGAIKSIFGGDSEPAQDMTGKTLSDFSSKAISGRTVDFASFAGKPVLIVNVASK